MGNDRDLSGNDAGEKVGTNLADYRLEIENHLTRLREQGFTVLLSPREVEGVSPFCNPQVADGYMDMKGKCADDPKVRTDEQLLADEPKRSMRGCLTAAPHYRMRFAPELHVYKPKRDAVERLSSN